MKKFGRKILKIINGLTSNDANRPAPNMVKESQLDLPEMNPFTFVPTLYLGDL